jgi:hypothetical protein
VADQGTDNSLTSFAIIKARAEEARPKIAIPKEQHVLRGMQDGHELQSTSQTVAKDTLQTVQLGRKEDLTDTSACLPEGVNSHVSSLDVQSQNRMNKAILPPLPATPDQAGNTKTQEVELLRVQKEVDELKWLVMSLTTGGESSLPIKTKISKS